MKNIFTLLLLIFLSKFSSAQYQTISNSMGNFLVANYPSCVLYQAPNYFIDTLCSEIINEDSLIIEQSLAFGSNDLKYFKNIKYIELLSPIAYYDPMNFPESIKVMRLSGDINLVYQNEQIDYPDNLEELYVFIANSGNFQTIPNKLKILDIYSSDVNFENIPDSLEFLRFTTGIWGGIPSFNSFSNAVNLKSIIFEDLNNFEISNFSSNALNTLPISLKELQVSLDTVGDVSNFPPNLEILKLFSFVDTINVLTNFPETLKSIYIRGILNCLPNYPESVEQLQIICGNAFGVLPFCHPNFIPNVGMSQNLCSNPFYNVNGCAFEKTISGHIYNDINSNCTYEITDLELKDIPIALYDDQNNFIKKVYSQNDGFYAFSVTDGTYKVVLDTAETSLRKSCINQAYEYEFVIDGGVSFVEQNFELRCDTLIYNEIDSFDINLYSLSTFDSYRPGGYVRNCVHSKDQVYNEQLNCSSGVETVLDSIVLFQVKITGPVSFAFNEPSFTYSSNQDTLILIYSDTLGTPYNSRNFCYYLRVDTTALIGEVVCIHAVLFPPTGDMNLSNNQLSYCHQIVNSYDPNIKETYPFQMKPGFEDEFRYTIHFQNTGNAPAINVMLIDTLDTKLALETFKVINSSHDVVTTLDGNRLIFKFLNINLADSLSSPEGSKGYVEYSLKPKNAMVLDEKIYNKAYIYFDFNEAIITNTSENWCTTWELTTNDLTSEESELIVYPNPLGNDRKITIKTNLEEDLRIELFNLNGQLISNHKLEGKQNSFYLKDIEPGAYVLKISSKSAQMSKKLIVF